MDTSSLLGRDVDFASRRKRDRVGPCGLLRGHGSVLGTTAKAGPRTAVDWEPVPQGLGWRRTINLPEKPPKKTSPAPVSADKPKRSHMLASETPLRQRQRAALAQLAEAHSELEAARRAE